jgi:multiple sugar transport system permease protein
LSTSTLRSKKSPYLFLLPAVLLMAVILIVPIFSGLRLSFFQWQLRDIGKSPTFVGLRNYGELFANEYFWESVKVTIKFTASVVILEIIAGMIIALLLEEGVKGIRLFRTLFILPIMVAPVVVGVMWRFMYNQAYGKLNYFITSMGFAPVGWLSDPKIALISVIIADVWQWTPFVFLLCLAGLQGVPKELSEAATVDGANYLQMLFKVKLPYMASIIGITAVLRLIDAFRSLVVILNMTNGGPGVSTEVLSLHLYKLAFTGQRLGMASAVAVILLLLIVSLSLVLVINSVKKEGK